MDPVAARPHRLEWLGPGGGPRVIAVQTAAMDQEWERPWGLDLMERLLDDPRVVAAVVRGTDADAGDIGFALARVIADEAEILSFGVLPVARRAGVGSGLLDALLNKLRARGAALVSLEVADGNNPALHMYRRAGFAPVGRRPNYYRFPNGARDAIVMSFRFDNASFPDG